jgi:hypothetical protein
MTSARPVSTDTAAGSNTVAGSAGGRTGVSTRFSGSDTKPQIVAIPHKFCESLSRSHTNEWQASTGSWPAEMPLRSIRRGRTRRAVIDNGDFERYWRYFTELDHLHTHAVRYQGQLALAA